MPGDSVLRVAVVIEDDADIRDLIEMTLSQAGFTVHTAGDGPSGVELVRLHAPAVTTLDISMPGIDGFEVARRIRTFSSTYLVMLTARDEEIDTLMGLDSGADDYLTKPFRPRELRARVEALMRRPRGMVGTALTPEAGVSSPADPPRASEPGLTREPSAGSPDGPEHSVAATGAGAGNAYTHNGLTLGLETRLVELDGVAIHLTRTEFDLLAAVVSAQHRVVGKDELVHVMWSDHYDTGLEPGDADRRAVEVHIANLRRKLGDAPSKARYIETVRGVGYRLSSLR